MGRAKKGTSAPSRPPAAAARHDRRQAPGSGSQRECRGGIGAAAGEASADGMCLSRRKRRPARTVGHAVQIFSGAQAGGRPQHEVVVHGQPGSPSMSSSSSAPVSAATRTSSVVEGQAQEDRTQAVIAILAPTRDGQAEVHLAGARPRRPPGDARRGARAHGNGPRAARRASHSSTERVCVAVRARCTAHQGGLEAVAIETGSGGPARWIIFGAHGRPPAPVARGRPPRPRPAAVVASPRPGWRVDRRRRLEGAAARSGRHERRRGTARRPRGSSRHRRRGDASATSRWTRGRKRVGRGAASRTWCRMGW